MTQEDEILQHLQGIAWATDTVRLFSIYKGLPISLEAAIQALTPQAVTFQVNKYLATCLEMQRVAFIQSEWLPGVIRGDVLRVDFLEERVDLASFAYTEQTIGNRALVRVQPGDPIQVEIRVKGRRIRGELADISLSGAGMYTSAIFSGALFFPIHASVRLDFVLPTSVSPARINGKILHVNKVKPSTYRLGIILFPDSEVRALLSNYVAQRQAEILRELRAMNEAFRRMQSGKSG